MGYDKLKQNLLDFVEWVNNDTEELDYDSTADFYRTCVDESFVRQFTNRESGHSGDTLRVSALGKPAVLQALKVLGYSDNSTEKPNRQLRYIFHLGDNFEAYILMLAKAYGYTLIKPQAEVDYMGVKGHIDCVFGTKDGDALIEVKTMSQRYFNSFSKKQDDDRGYITQAAVYSECLQLPLFWLCFDKGTGKVHLVEPSKEQLSKALNRAARIIPLLREVRSVECVLTKFKAPPATPEVYKRSETGLYLLPESMKWSSFVPVFYELADGLNQYNKPTRYVVSYNDVETATQALENLSNV